MFLNSTKMLLANTMMIGVIMTICSNNWISMWMGLEMVLLSFIPFMQSDNLMSSESMIKYFIVQSVASTLMLLSVIIMLIGVGMINEIMLMTAMLIKLGAAPFHNWVLMVIEKLNYYTMFTLLTVIKMPPLTILYQINAQMLNISIMMSMIISSISCLNQTSIRKTMGYSSIYNLALMMSIINMYNMTTMYMILYSIMMIMLIYMVNTLKMNFINQMVFNEKKMSMKINLWINMLSMGGFPPMMGFLLKLMVIQLLMLNKQLILMMMLIVTSLMVMMFYMRLAFTSMIGMSLSKKWNNNKSNSSLFLMQINIMLTPILVSMVNIY